MTHLERLIRNSLLAIWRDRDIGDVDVDQVARIAADIATIHLERQQPLRVTPLSEGLELRYKILIPYAELEAKAADATAARASRS